jgi:hypothetical protein
VTHINGIKIVIRDPVPCTKRVAMFKKHRRKKQWTPRVKIIVGYMEMVKDGDVFHDRINNVMYMNSKTFAQLNQYTKERGR